MIKNTRKPTKPLEERLIGPNEEVHLPLPGATYVRLRARAQRLGLSAIELLVQWLADEPVPVPKTTLTAPPKTHPKDEHQFTTTKLLITVKDLPPQAAVRALRAAAQEIVDQSHQVANRLRRPASGPQRPSRKKRPIVKLKEGRK